MSAGARRAARRLARGLAAALLLLIAAPWAAAHLMPAQQGTLNLVGRNVFVVLSLPAAAVPEADADHDGRLSAAEIPAHAALISARVAQGLRLDDGRQQAQVDFIDLLPEPDERSPRSSAGAAHLAVLMKLHFAAEPQVLRLACGFFDRPGVTQLTLQAHHGKLVEAVVLTPWQSGHVFFRSPARVFADYVTLGVEHIALGADHLLFLLTIVVAGAGWRHWAGVLTSFTLAHSVTLTLSSLGWLHVAPAIVEPLIAASIVLMALLNLWRPHTGMLRRAAIVFGCGLLHGLGFASAMADLGLHGLRRAASLVGFNLGIELGQAGFVAAVLLLGLVIRHLWWWTGAEGGVAQRIALPRLASAAAAVVGAFWLAQRLAA
jgi:hydrogenase/urease accessory protein HupE